MPDLDQFHRSGPLTSAANGTSGNSWEGRFLRQHEQSLLEHLGDKPPEMLRFVAIRLSRLALQLEVFDRRFLRPDAAPSLDDLRVYSNLHSVYLSGIREILKQAAGDDLPGDPLAALRAHLSGQVSGAPDGAADPSEAT